MAGMVLHYSRTIYMTSLVEKSDAHSTEYRFFSYIVCGFCKPFMIKLKQIKNKSAFCDQSFLAKIYRSVGDVLHCAPLCSTVLQKCGNAKSHASLLVVAMVHLLWLSGSCSCYFSHTFETRDRIRKIECIKVKAESRARRESNQWLLLWLLEPIYSKNS